MVEIFESHILSPVSLTPAVNLSPGLLTPVINCRFTIVIDLDIVIDTENKFMTKVVDNGHQFITCVSNTDKKVLGAMSTVINKKNS